MYPDHGVGANTIAQIEGGQNNRNDQKLVAPSLAQQATLHNFVS